MSDTRSLTKKELNERFYSTVDPETAFETEVQIGFHQVAVARLVARQAATLGLQRIRVLELGASTCLFATAFLEVLGELVTIGDSDLAAVEYTAVEFSRAALKAAIAGAEKSGKYEKVTPTEASPATDGEEVTELARLHGGSGLEVDIVLVHADANRFVEGAAGPFDFVILNELLDDLPCRAFYSDREGARHELFTTAHADGSTWKVELSAADASEEGWLAGLPAGTLTATSDESVRLIGGIVELLERGGLLLIHDYGFMEPCVDVGQYAAPQERLPPFVEMEYPKLDGVPKSFFRVYGNDAAGSVQVTNDVNLGELAEILAQTGMVIALPHGNLLIQTREWPNLFEKDDGVFVSEFMLLTKDDDLPALLASLCERQRELHDRYVRELGGGRTAIFNDLIYVKS